MEIELVQAFIPIVHTGIDEGISSALVSWLEKYWWIPVLLIFALIVFFIIKNKNKQNNSEQPKQEIPSELAAYPFSYRPNGTI